MRGGRVAFGMTDISLTHITPMAALSIALSVVVAFAKASGGGVDLAALALVSLRILGYFALALVAGRLVKPILRWSASLQVSQATLAAALVIAFIYAWAAEYVGEVAAITGAYLAGVFVAQSGYKDRIDAGIHPLTYSMFVPVFFISIGLQANGRELGPHALFTLVLVAVAIVAKVIGSGAGARPSASILVRPPSSQRTASWKPSFCRLITKAITSPRASQP